ncbi:MAG: hypothetical protein N2595_05775 [bacterium]|nr:hypothetical protein [bacterium]
MTAQVFKDFLHSARTTAKWHRMRHLLTPQDKLLILLHGEPDPDSMAAGWAFQHLVRPRVHSVRLVATQPVKREQNVRFLRTLKVPIEFVDAVPWDSFTKIALVDAQPHFFHSPPPVPFDIVIDHHPRRQASPLRCADIRPNYGSTATILLEYLLVAGVPLPRKLATALWFALRTDTDNLTRLVHTADLAAYSFLYRKSDRSMVQWLEQSDIPAAYREFYIRGLYLLDPARGRDVIYLGDIPQPDVCVHIADFLARFMGVRWLAVAGIAREMLYVIFRSGSYSVNVGSIARRKLEPFGSAGGHRDKARAEIPATTLAKILNLPLTDVRVEQWLRSVLLGTPRTRAHA